MRPLRVTRNVATLVLAWFTLVLATSFASALAGRVPLDAICTSAGIVVPGDASSLPAGPAHQLDCPLCIAVGPLPAPQGEVPVALAPAAAPLASAGVAPAQVATAAPLSARAPPRS